jgi:hypothetical protein
MKKYIFIILGTLLLTPVMVSDALGINLNTFREEVFRPENLPTSNMGSASTENKIASIINFLIDIILYASGAVAVLMLVIGAIMIIGSVGNQERKEQGVKIIKYAVIGLFTVILAYAVVTNVIDIIFRATT